MSEPSVPGAVDYLALGHVTLDLQPDDTIEPGGTVLYGAIQAARLGLRSKVISAGNPAELEAPLRPFRHEIEIELLPSPVTTTFTNRGIGGARRQVVNAWAGRMNVSARGGQLPPARIVHLGPVAQEIDPNALPPLPASTLLGVTPQGWLREWGPDGAVHRVELRLPPELVARIDVLVLSENECQHAATAIAGVLAHGGIVAVTLGEHGCDVHVGTRTWRVPAGPVDLVDDTGAGDVFAAAFLVFRAGGLDPLSAARAANAAAGFSIEALGVTGIAHRARLATRLEHEPGQINDSSME